MFKIKLIAKMANKAMEEILEEKDLNITELNHLIYAAATVITEEINGTAECKIKAQRSKPHPWVRRIQGSINDIRKELSVLVEIKRDNRKVQNIKRTRLFKKYNIEKEEDLNRLIEELNPLSPELNPICYLLALLAHDFLHVSRIRVKQKVAAKTQRLSRYRKRQNQY
jgi:transposase